MPHPAAMTVIPTSAFFLGVPCQSHAFSASFHGNKCHGGPGHERPSGRPVNTGLTPSSHSPCFLAKLSLLPSRSFWIDLPYIHPLFSPYQKKTLQPSCPYCSFLEVSGLPAVLRPSCFTNSLSRTSVELKSFCGSYFSFALLN